MANWDFIVFGERLRMCRDEGARQQLCHPFSAGLVRGQRNPGRRCALPWADMCGPVGAGEFAPKGATTS